MNFNITAVILLVVLTLCFQTTTQHVLKRDKRQDFQDYSEEITDTVRTPRQGELIFSGRPPNRPAPSAQTVFINNDPTLATIAPFMPPTTPSSAFSDCFSRCPTTPEYNPICASNMELYTNEQKYNCALRCGANIQIVRRGSCEGLFPMTRG